MFFQRHDAAYYATLFHLAYCYRVRLQSGNGVLLAYQIAFDLYENASQQFISKIEKALVGEEPPKLSGNESDSTQATPSSSCSTDAASKFVYSFYSCSYDFSGISEQ